jgi:hypothetical protein
MVAHRSSRSLEKGRKGKRHSKKRWFCLGFSAVVLGLAFHCWTTTFVSSGYWDDPDHCALHGVKTESEFVTNHGFVTASYDGAIFEAKREKFPLDTINTGYGHPNTRYKRILRKFCPECRKARIDWLRGWKKSEVMETSPGE